MNRHDHRNFRRLAALLLALAELAEHAGTRCLAVRWLVLWALRPAQEAARAYAIEVAGSPFLLLGCQRTGNTPDDAAHLAGNLRMLAAVFSSLAHRASLASSGAPRGLFFSTPTCVVADRLRALLAPPILRLDTS